MGTGLSFWGVGVALVLSVQPIEAQLPSLGSRAYLFILRTACSGLERFAGQLTFSKIPILADGGDGGSGGDGGDGGGSDGGGEGGGSDGGGSDGGDGSGDGSSGEDGGTSDRDGDGARCDAENPKTRGMSASLYRQAFGARTGDSQVFVNYQLTAG